MYLIATGDAAPWTGHDRHDFSAVRLSLRLDAT